MKIAMIGQKGMPSRAGGIEIHVEELGAHLAEMGHEVLVYVRHDYCDENCATYRGMQVINVASINTKCFDTITYSFLATIMALRSGAEIIHYHALGPSLFAFLPKIFGKKVVCTVHGLDWQREKWKKPAKIVLKLGEIAAMKFADSVISVSDSLLDYFSTNYQKKPVHIANGVYVKPVQSVDMIQSTFGLQKDGFILFLSRIVPEKGVHFLIEAYNRLTTDKKLVIAGAASHSDAYFRSVHQLANNHPKIIFTDFVQGKVLEELYSNAYIYVLPSTTEGLPISLLEAMSYGTCCLTSNIPENTTVLKKHGYTFENKNVDDLASTLSRLLEDRNGYDREDTINYIKNKYSWLKAAKKTEQVYASVMNAALLPKQNHSWRKSG